MHESEDTTPGKTETQADMTAQLMHQFYNLEQQFKQTATSIMMEPIMPNFISHPNAQFSNNQLSRDDEALGNTKKGI